MESVSIQSISRLRASLKRTPQHLAAEVFPRVTCLSIERKFDSKNKLKRTQTDSSSSPEHGRRCTWPQKCQRVCRALKKNVKRYADTSCGMFLSWQTCPYTNRWRLGHIFQPQTLNRCNISPKKATAGYNLKNKWFLKINFYRKVNIKDLCPPWVVPKLFKKSGIGWYIPAIRMSRLFYCLLFR